MNIVTNKQFLTKFFLLNQFLTKIFETTPVVRLRVPRSKPISVKSNEPRRNVPL